VLQERSCTLVYVRKPESSSFLERLWVFSEKLCLTFSNVARHQWLDRQVENMDECKCGSCLKMVTNQNDGVLCEICETWFHSRCQPIPDPMSVLDPMYKVMSQYRKDLHWFCKGCSGGVEKLLAALGRLQGKIDKIEEEMLRLHNDFQLEISTAVKEFRSEIQQVDNRLRQCESKTVEYGLELQKSINPKLSEMETRCLLKRGSQNGLRLKRVRLQQL
jgi:hypothetical protein